MPATTEQLHVNAVGIDQRPLSDVVSLLVDAQSTAASCVSSATDSLARGAQAMASTLSAGGTLYYVAAGSSGLMAAADALELGGTFSIPPERLRILMPGGLPQSVEMPGDVEDVFDGLAEELANLNSIDTVITVSASGTTPYTLKAARMARDAGARVIGLANNPGCALLEAADIAIALPTPPEVLSGSTRLGAGTAQKIALNTLSTAMAVALGHVHDGMMVNLRADNDKLRQRAKGIVSRIAGTDAALAQKALSQADGEVKPAVLIAAQSVSLQEAQSRLAQANGNLRAALARSTEQMNQPGDQS